jgi:hypothetical protein
MNAVTCQAKVTAMKAIEFQSHLIDGKILVPAECGLQEGQDVRVLILVEDATTTSRLLNLQSRASGIRLKDHGREIRWFVKIRANMPTRLRHQSHTRGSQFNRG